MSSQKLSRRTFVKTAASGFSLACIAPGVFVNTARAAEKSRNPNERLKIGSIGMRYQGSVIADKAQEYGDIVAIADVDREIAEKARKQFGGKATLFEDYREMLEKADIDVVTIGAPDHWHTKMLIDACRAGKDVYCEKPLTLTVDEGKILNKVVKETKAVVQVGTWQRSDHRFRQAVEMVHDGRIGNLKKVTVTLSKNKTGGPFKPEPVPSVLNWDLWQGQTPDVPYIKERCHYTFRWWYEYSGGQMTDWGAHHIDIAQWGAGMQDSGPVDIEGTATFPNVENGFNVALDYHLKARYANGVILEVNDTGRTGVMFEGDKGRMFVNRGTIAGKPVEDLAKNPLPREKFNVYGHDNLSRPPRMGKLDAIVNHMGNFFDCIETRETPISSVENQHRSVSVCHIGNISQRLGRKLTWDPQQEQFVGDDEANTWLKREQRAGYEIKDT